jgi:hypothetical protein
LHRYGPAVVMQLIVAKQPVTALGLTPEAAEARYGPYVTAAPGEDIDDAAAMAAVIRKGVRAVICVGKAGAIPVGLRSLPGVRLFIWTILATGCHQLDGFINRCFDCAITW